MFNVYKLEYKKYMMKICIHKALIGAYIEREKKITNVLSIQEDKTYTSR